METTQSEWPAKDETTEFVLARERCLESRGKTIKHGIHWAACLQFSFQFACIYAVMDGFFWAIIGSTFFSILTFAAVTLPVGVFCGWLSHHWFYASTISVSRMTVVLVVIAEITIFGWILALFYSSQSW